MLSSPLLIFPSSGDSSHMSAHLPDAKNRQRPQHFPAGHCKTGKSWVSFPTHAPPHRQAPALDLPAVYSCNFSIWSSAYCVFPLMPAFCKPHPCSGMLELVCTGQQELVINSSRILLLIETSYGRNIYTLEISNHYK